MTSNDAAIAKLDAAIARLEAAAERLSQAGDDPRLAELEAENRRLAKELEKATAGQDALEGRVRDVSGRLDHVIGDLKEVLGR